MAPGDVSPWWQHVETLIEFPTGARKFRCHHCSLERVGTSDRVRAHLLRIKNKGIVICTQVPIEKEAEYDALSRTERRRITTRAPPTASLHRPPASRGVSYESCTGPAAHAFFPPHGGEASGSQTQPLGASTSTGTNTQGTLPSAWLPGFKQQADASIARFFYTNGISFNAIRTQSFSDMVDAIAAAGRGYVPPKYEAIREKLLAAEKATIDRSMQMFREDWETYGVSLVADGWTDRRRRSLQGILACSRGRTFFLRAIDNSEEGKTAARIFEMWDEAVMQMGPTNVIMFIADGENTNRAAGRMLQDKYPHIFFQPCMAHCLNNLLKDIGKVEEVQTKIEAGQKIVNFIISHHYILAVFRKFATKELLKYSETRFAYNFLLLHRLHDQRHALQQLVVSGEWRASPLHSTPMGIFVHSHCLDNSFWVDVKSHVDMTLPIVKMMRMVDAETPCLGKVYEGMDKMVEQVMEATVDSELRESMRSLAANRWDSYYTPLQAVAYVLDPEFQHKKQYKDAEVATGWDEGLRRLVPDAGSRRLIKDQISFYRKREGVFGSPDAQADRFLRGSALWWEDYGASTPQLQDLAIRVLSHGCSSSPCERLWSSYGNIASVKRNRLGAEKANDLVFVNANLRLMQQLRRDFQQEPFIGFDDGDAERIMLDAGIHDPHVLAAAHAVPRIDSEGDAEDSGSSFDSEE